ncbi:MAG: MFS transporter [Rhodospirillaceae bacterium]|jgi:16S rRNA (cytosine967-C5)-methyltransferase|nr:MFS transporter [Rhodospirillaceae bacterium]MBT4589170.1 MFS transporter [Rhodospirillaceae bacterium]MBT4941043.1 MFS transporter [Rhodospirillaceae bacterium]MBT7266188.1 MFS transporter [Rhodospirillaceae bacterium]
MPRSLAFDVLTVTLHSSQPFDDAFNQHPRVNKLEPRDRGFAFNIVITTLRHLGQIDDIIDKCLDKKLPPKARLAKIILRIGICQLLFLDTPQHAAVSTSVDLADQQKQGPYKKLINAILRRVTREREKLLAGQDIEKLNTPSWLWDSWAQAYGEETTRRIAAAHLEMPALDLSVKSDPAGWAEKLEAQFLPTGGIRLPASTNVTELAGYEDGAWWVQDAAASLPAQLFGKDLTGKKIADICAAPGGKAAQLLAAGAEVIALDRSEKRLVTLAENLSRLALTAETICADAAAWRPDVLLDGVLLDAPCSATGTIRRHPDVQNLKREKDVSHAHQAQLRLLNAAAEMVKPEGIIVFATCSLQPEEGPDVIEAFLTAHPNWQRQPINAQEIGDNAEFITDAGDLRTFPYFRMDGFFAARLGQK